MAKAMIQKNIENLDGDGEGGSAAAINEPPL